MIYTKVFLYLHAKINLTYLDVYQLQKPAVEKIKGWIISNKNNTLTKYFSIFFTKCKHYLTNSTLQSWGQNFASLAPQSMSYSIYLQRLVALSENKSKEQKRKVVEGAQNIEKKCSECSIKHEAPCYSIKGFTIMNMSIPLLDDAETLTNSTPILA